MDRQISIAEAKNKLTAIIHDVEKGPAIQLTRYGKPVAVLLSAREYDRLCKPGGKFWAELSSLRQLMKQEGVQFTNSDFEKLRDASTGRKIDF